MGFDNVKAVNINYSVTALGSYKDRHANLGNGRLGDSTLKKILHRKEFHNTPFLLETPALKEYDTAQKEISHLKELAK